MTDYDRDRGAYSPSGETPLAFDARQETQGGGGRPPFALIISALILLILVLALIFYYRSGVRQAGQPPVVGAPLGAMSSAAPSSAQPEQEATGLQVYSAEQSAPPANAPTFAPGPEQPLPRAAAPAVTPSPSGPPPSAAELRPAAPAPSAVPAAPPASAPVQAAAAPTPAPQQAKPAPKPVAPAPKPAAAPAAATAKPAAAAPAASGGAAVQIGALASPALADKAWNDVARKLPADMAGRTKRVEPVTTSTGATLYRAYIGGFDSKTEAQAFCAKLKAAGGACIVR